MFGRRFAGRGTDVSEARLPGVWDDGWEERLRSSLRAHSSDSVLTYLAERPGLPYGDVAHELAERLALPVAPVQLEQLQVRDTPREHLADAVRDSLARLLRGAFLRVGWRQGPYWQSKIAGVLATWVTMWDERVPLKDLRRAVFELNAPVGWIPRDGRDPLIQALPVEAQLHA